jgi:hypothetical protein
MHETRLGQHLRFKSRLRRALSRLARAFSDVSAIPSSAVQRGATVFSGFWPMVAIAELWEQSGPRSG